MTPQVPKALVPLTDGTEEMEAVTIIDVLRRAGWGVTSVGMKPGLITASRGVKLQPDRAWDEISAASFDVLVIPGGKGARTLAEDPRLLETIRDFRKADKWLAAICAAPLVLQAAGVLDGVKVTSHPSVIAELRGPWQKARVVVDGRIVTSQGPGTAIEFALTLIRLIQGQDTADEVAAPMVLA